MSDGHFGGGHLDNLHISLNNAIDGGACLTGHDSDYYSGTGNRFNRNTCCYRWQCLNRSAEEWHDYLLHLYRPRDFVRLDPQTNTWQPVMIPTSPGAPAWYATHINPPLQEGDWHLGGHFRDQPMVAYEKKRPTDNGRVTHEVIPRTYNFYRAAWPYWNNAHHLIPKGTLRSAINNRFADAAHRDLILQGLLQARYNVNHWRNMVFLPMDLEVAKILKTLRHQQRHDNDDGDLEYPNYSLRIFNHVKYNKKAKKELNSVLNDFAQELDRRDNAHPDPNFRLAKEKLERVSESLIEFIFWKSTSANKGKSLDRVAEETAAAAAGAGAADAGAGAGGVDVIMGGL